METFLLNLLKTSLLGSLAILAMLVLKPLWRERYRAKTRCWLWLALAVFLLLPVDFSVKNAPVQAEPPKDYTLFVGTDKTTIQSTDNLFGDMAEKSGQSPAAVRDTIIQRPVTNPEQKTTRYIPVTTILFYGYLAGAAAFLLYQGVSYALFRRTVRRWKRDVARADYAAMLSDTARDLGVSAPEMIVCEAISTPAVTGLLRPRLLLPHERYDVQELRYILRHELCHLKRRDMLLKLVLLAANAMHWFNPVVYLMLRQADEDIELACDSAATDGLELPERAAYSRTLLAAGLDSFGWYQLRKIFQPKACPFAVRVPKFIRLYCLRISRQIIYFARDRIFNADSFAVCIQKFHKKSFARQSFFVPFPIQNVIFPQMSCSCIAEIGTRRVRNQHIPSAVHCV